MCVTNTINRRSAGLSLSAQLFGSAAASSASALSKRLLAGSSVAAFRNSEGTLSTAVPTKSTSHTTTATCRPQGHLDHSRPELQSNGCYTNNDITVNVSGASHQQHASVVASPTNPWQLLASNDAVATTTTTPVPVQTQKKKKRRRRKPQKPGKTAKMNDRHFVVHNYHDHADDEEEDYDSSSGNHTDCGEEECNRSSSSSSNDGKTEEPSNSSSDGSKVLPKRRGGVAIAFPLKLHTMLERIEADGLGHVISWQPHGRAFLVHKPKEFVDHVMPKYFRQSKLTSFQRQLNLYGFARLTKGPDNGAYYHELFLRGKAFLTKQMVRTKVKGTGFKAASSPDSEPDFYQMKPVVPKPSVVTPSHSDADDEMIDGGAAEEPAPFAEGPKMLATTACPRTPFPMSVESPDVSPRPLAPHPMLAGSTVSPASSVPFPLSPMTSATDVDVRSTENFTPNIRVREMSPRDARRVDLDPYQPTPVPPNLPLVSASSSGVSTPSPGFYSFVTGRRMDVDEGLVVSMNHQNLKNNCQRYSTELLKAVRNFVSDSTVSDQQKAHYNNGTCISPVPLNFTSSFDEMNNRESSGGTVVIPPPAPASPVRTPRKNITVSPSLPIKFRSGDADILEEVIEELFIPSVTGTQEEAAAPATPGTSNIRGGDDDAILDFVRTWADPEQSPSNDYSATMMMMEGSDALDLDDDEQFGHLLEKFLE